MSIIFECSDQQKQQQIQVQPIQRLLEKIVE